MKTKRAGPLHVHLPLLLILSYLHVTTGPAHNLHSVSDTFYNLKSARHRIQQVAKGVRHRIQDTECRHKMIRCDIILRVGVVEISLQNSLRLFRALRRREEIKGRDKTKD